MQTIQENKIAHTAIYARVSSDDQRQAGTIESQVFALREICKRNNAQIVKEYIDDGWTGATLARPALDELRDDAKKGIWDTLYVYESSRLGRDHIDQAIVLRELKKQGIEVFFRERPLTEENSLLTNIESIIAEHEKKTIIERTRRGKLHKVRMGKTQNCMPPYGYKRELVDKEWKVLVDEETTQVVRFVFKRYLECQNIKKICNELVEQGIRNRKNIRTKERHYFSNKRIREMLRNEAFVGRWFWYKRENAEPKRRTKKYTRLVNSSRRVTDRSQWISVPIPAIISQEQFDEVQEIRKKNFKKYAFTKHFWLLNGLLKCGRCGGSMQGHFSGKHYYYRCEQITNRIDYKDICSPIPTIRRDIIEPLVWERIKGILQSPEMLLDYARSKANNGDKQLILEEREALLKQKEAIAKKQERFFDLYEEEKIEKRKLLERVSGLGEEEKRLERVIKAIDARLTQESRKESFGEKIVRFAEQNKFQLEHLTDQIRKEVLRTMVEEITYYGKDRIEVKGLIPVDDKQEGELILMDSMVSLAVSPE